MIQCIFSQSVWFLSYFGTIHLLGMEFTPMFSTLQAEQCLCSKLLNYYMFEYSQKEKCL